MDRQTARELRAEFLGTFVLIAFGCGSVAQAKLGGHEFGSFLTINLAWGMAVALGIVVSAAGSGGHLNPAVSLALAFHRRFPWRKVPLYALAQTAGAFVGAAAVYLTYYEALAAYDQGVRAVLGPTGTAGIFATYPAAHLSTFPGGFTDQIIGTALLMMVVLGVGDPRNESWAKPLAPLLIGLLVAVIGMAFGFNAGYAVNPARDLGPRLFTLVAGWGPEVFIAGNYWWWVPIVGPLLGALFGGVLYDTFLPKRRALNG
jgi:MIP family channel proteins